VRFVKLAAGTRQPVASSARVLRLTAQGGDWGIHRLHKNAFTVDLTTCVSSCRRRMQWKQCIPRNTPRYLSKLRSCGVGVGCDGNVHTVTSTTSIEVGTCGVGVGCDAVLITGGNVHTVTSTTSIEVGDRARHGW